MKTRIKILTEGSSIIGFGHITRCIAIHEAFESLGYYSEIYIDGDETVKKTFLSKKFKIVDWKNKSKDFLRFDNNVILIIDSYTANIDVLSNLADEVTTCIFIDDNNRLSYPPGIILNSTINCENLFHTMNPKNKYLLGSNYTPLRKEFWENQPKTISSKVKSVLVSLGGTDIKGLTPKVVNLIGNHYSDMRIKAVIGKVIDYQYINELERKNIDIIINADGSLMKKLMIEADIAITAAGQTIYELAATGTPTIAIVVAENQRNNLNGWIEAGFIKESLMWDDEQIEYKIIMLIGDFLDESLRKKISILGQKKIDGKGAIRLAKEALKDYLYKRLKLRKAVKEDLKNTFNLANDYNVRINSFKTQQITIEEHTNWFNQKIISPDTHYYIAEINGDFVGQIRFDLDQDIAVTSISVASEFRGYGIGKKIIDLGINKLKLEVPHVKNILAEIKKVNHKSLNVFLANNFVINKDLSNQVKYVLNCRSDEII